MAGHRDTSRDSDPSRSIPEIYHLSDVSGKDQYPKNSPGTESSPGLLLSLEVVQGDWEWQVTHCHRDSSRDSNPPRSIPDIHHPREVPGTGPSKE